jgi:hypothetical protein
MLTTAPTPRSIDRPRHQSPTFRFRWRRTGRLYRLGAQLRVRYVVKRETKLMCILAPLSAASQFLLRIGMTLLIRTGLIVVHLCPLLGRVFALSHASCRVGAAAAIRLRHCPIARARTDDAGWAPKSASSAVSARAEPALPRRGFMVNKAWDSPAPALEMESRSIKSSRVC